jgi:2-dehydro-3-deoxyphosphogluconate aldolase / (4S)-4-hydroxy-2-oxoglutarate aldolase
VTDEQLRAELAERGIVAVLRAGPAERAVAAARALAEGGVTAIEVTFSVPDAPSVIAELATDESLLVGAGTVLSADQVDAAVHAGARFVVSPNIDEEVLDAAESRGVPALPGVFTPTEVARAARRCSLLKLFPASLGGPALLGALREPFPGLAFVPTGGVTAGGIGDWLRAGAIAVGAGGDLCPREAIEAADLEQLRARARHYAAAFAESRGITSPDIT